MKAGYEVRVAESAAEAMSLCRMEPFTVLLSDVVMPGMNGYELVKWVAAEHPETRTILMSGFNEVCSDGYREAPQPFFFLPKPFVPQEAIAIVERALSVHAPRPPQPAR